MNQRPGTYATYLWMLHRICHEAHFRGEQRDFDKLREYGWIKPRHDEGVASADWIERQRCEMASDELELSWWYVLTAKGHFVLSPRENRVVEPVAAVCFASGRITWDGFYLLNWWKS